MSREHVLTLDLHDDPALIEAYDQHHRAVWPEIEQSIRASGIEAMRIYRLETRLVMVITVDDTFSFTRKAAADEANAAVREWEALMGRFQRIGPDGEKWRAMRPIYRLGT